MTHVTCRLTAKNRDQLRNPTLGNRVWATFTFLVAKVGRNQIHSVPTIFRVGGDASHGSYGAVARISPARNHWPVYICPPAEDRRQSLPVISATYAVFLTGTFFWRKGNPPPSKKLKIPPNGCQTVCSNSFFFGRDNELRTYRGNLDLMHSKHGKLFVVKQSQGCKFMPKMHKNTFSGRAPPWPDGGAYALLQTP